MAIRKRYRSWKRASKAAGSGYQAEELALFRLRRSGGIVGNEENYAKPTPELLSIMAEGTDPFVDFGGSAGELCAVLQRRFPQRSFAVVETPGIVKAASALRPTIGFSTSLPDKIGIFYSSGTLQYLEDPYVLWEDCLRRTSEYAFLARNTFSEKECFRVQHSMLFNNGAGPIPDGFSDIVIRYPHRTVSERRLVEIASDVGFKLIKRVADRSDGLIHGADDMYGADLLFKRN
ncbi:UNVERIFIED_ORG: putative methyltransferase (TIGR04325 family) [Rhizobium etli]